VTAPVATRAPVAARATRATRVVADLSRLPHIAFGPRDILWWGTLCFVVIEGFTLVLTAVVNVYLTQNFATWPPQGTPLPSLGVPTIQVAVMLASLPIAWWTSRRAREFDFERVRVGLAIGALANGAIALLRVWELVVSLNVSWDANAYGSAQWLVAGTHGTLVLIEFVEMTGIALAFWFGPVEEKHFSDVVDMVMYWFFIVLSWIPLYVLCFWLPRWL
jgi:cytochrome c oxidase subunit I+III